MSAFKIKKIFFCLTLPAVMLACSQNAEDNMSVPDTILSEEVFTKVLVDFALAESVGNINVNSVAADKMDSVYAFDPLKENKVSKPQYDSAVAFYSKHPAIYKKIYENVLAELSKMQTKPDSTKTAPASK